jgi:hypothetical protein
MEEQMRTDQHRACHDARQKDMMLQAELDEASCFLEGVDLPSSLDSPRASGYRSV